MKQEHRFTDKEIQSAFNAALSEHPEIAYLIENKDQVEAIAIGYINKNNIVGADIERRVGEQSVDLGEVLYQKTKHIKEY